MNNIYPFLPDGTTKAKTLPVILLPSGAKLDFSGPALVMAVVNCTGDSFYAPSRALLDEAVDRALAAEATEFNFQLEIT
jgi:hypothetical protein